MLLAPRRDTPEGDQSLSSGLREESQETDDEMGGAAARHDHGKNLSGKDRIKLCAKSLISQVYDLLARHSYNP